MLFNIIKIKRKSYEKGKRDMFEEATSIAREQVKTITKKKDIIIEEQQNRIAKLETQLREKDLRVEKIENTFANFGLVFGEAKYCGLSLEEANEAQMLLDIDRFQKVQKVVKTMEKLSRLFRKPKRQLDKEIQKYKKQKAQHEKN